ncbi:tRNA pseudouridine synthase A [Hyposmocoma kahamanoa]|uniref:tRNA pseudouridine synthase A n=1 Tax=Hyposmocoma kahamanoa TaxID=1477025 RepID=UPI000E6D8E6A|nr:tRNA pseudouridine synthase A [Hyposmocoma kahamanoa]
MSVKLLNLFVNTIRQNLPKYSKSVAGFALNQLRFSTAMDVADIEKKEEIIGHKNATRYKKRFMKRQWEDLKKVDGESDEKREKVDRIKRKKVAMLLGYCGVDYSGMQRNPGVNTIEEELLKALWDAKYITEEDFNNQQNAHFQRSSRTDKGVSAARQVVSLKLPLETDIEEINKRLPECIKVFGIKRVTNKFNSKVKCNARTYSYTLPTYVFEPKAVTDDQRKSYRISADKLQQTNDVLAVYKGTKSYHNFTEKKHYQDPSASRYMMDFSIEKVFVESDMEFAVLLVKGQSFMLHQIRKMVGLTIAIVRGHTDMSIMEKAFGKDKVIIPTAPGLGLVLDMVHYDRYDNKFKDSHASLTWEAEEEAVQQFRHEHIFPNIIKGEIEGNSMGIWLEKLNLHSYEPSDDVPGEKNDVENEKEADDDDDDPNTNDDVDNDEEVKSESKDEIGV